MLLVSSLLRLVLAVFVQIALTYSKRFSSQTVAMKEGTVFNMQTSFMH